MSSSTKYAVESCIRPMKKTTGSLSFRIMGHSLDKDIEKGKFFESTIFNVGGYDWCINYYPTGFSATGDDYVSIYLCLKSKEEDAKAQFSFTILDQSGNELISMTAAEMRTFKASGNEWGYESFAKRAELESKIIDDCFIIKCAVTVFKVLTIEPTPPIVVPPGNIQLQLGHLMETAIGADVTFEVNGITFNAHKCILAVRSPVFLAQFFGPLKEKSDTNIRIEEIEAPVFKSLLHFIYHDSLPRFEELKECEEEQDEDTQYLMALLAAADKYGLERLKIMCEKMLADTIDISKVVNLLSLADRHNCIYLKSTCLKLLVSADIIGDVVETEEFQQLVKNDPLILKELLQKHS